MIRDPELIRSVIVRNFDSFLNNDFNVDIMVDPLFGRNPVVIKDQAWKAIRPQLSPGFTAGKMKSLFPQLMEVCQEMKFYLECCGPSVVIDTKELCTKFSINAVASCAYGINGHTFEDPEAEFRKVGRKFLQPSFLKIVQQLFLLLAPKIASLLHFKVASLEVTEFFRKMTADATTYRRKEMLRKNDFLELLIQLKEKHEEQNKLENNRWFEKFTEEDIAAQALTFFTDGFETSSNALTMTLYEVAMNPGVQQRIRREVKEMLDRHGGGFTYEGLLELNYLDK
ncbi:unnamed protein product, partial [Timema podura]|nr:unnamed protein product [Timema podura]